MSRARDALAAALWWASLALAVAWWAPTFALLVLRLAGAAARFWAAMAVGDLLRAAGCPEAAGRLYLSEVARCERRRQKVRRWG